MLSTPIYIYIYLYLYIFICKYIFIYIYVNIFMYIYYIQMKRIMKCEIDKLIKKDFSYLFIYY